MLDYNKAPHNQTEETQTITICTNKIVEAIESLTNAVHVLNDQLHIYRQSH